MAWISLTNEKKFRGIVDSLLLGKPLNGDPGFVYDLTPVQQEVIRQIKNGMRRIRK